MLPLSARKRVLVAAHTGFISHAGRARLIADALSELGVAVTVAGDATQPYSKILGVAHNWSGPLLDNERVMQFAQDRVSWGFYDTQTLMEHVVAWQSLLQRSDFGVVVGDFALPAIIAAESLEIPTVTVQNVLWTSVFRFRLSPPERHWLQRLFERARLGGMARWLSRHAATTNLLHAVFQRIWARPFNAARRSLCLAPRSTYFAHTEGNLVLVADRQDLWDRYGRGSIEKYVAIGPMVWEPKSAEDEESGAIQQLVESGRRFVYASFGSSGTQAVFKLLLEAFRQRRDGLGLVLTTGGQFPGWAGWQDIPPQVVVAPFYPGGTAMAASGCVVTINHGGSGSAYQALAASKPLLMLPTHADQQWNAEMLHSLGLGVVISPSRLTPEHLNREIDRLVDLAGKSSGHP